MSGRESKASWRKPDREGGRVSSVNTRCGSRDPLPHGRASAKAAPFALLCLILLAFCQVCHARQAAEFPVTFVDAAQGAGLTSPIIYGGVERKRYIIETNGCGVAFFDYDDDGWMDVLLLNGTRL